MRQNYSLYKKSVYGGGKPCGDWCRFCKAKAVCRKRAEYNLELAKYDFEMPVTLEDAEIAAILEKADELAAWAADVKEFALQQALSGVKYDRFKVVEGRSNRKYTNEDTVADTVAKAGYDPYEPKLLDITAMEKLLGKKQFAKLLSGLIEKPQGKPALVPESDKRQEMNRERTHNRFFEKLSIFRNTLLTYFEQFNIPNEKLHTLCS